MDTNTVITSVTTQLTVELFKPIFKCCGKELKNFLAKRTLKKVLKYQRNPGYKISSRIIKRSRFFQIIGLKQPDDLIPMSKIGVHAFPIVT